MNNFTPTNLPCQLLNTEIVSNTTGFFLNNLTYTFKLIFKEYFSACQNYKKVYISHAEIARRVGCHRVTVVKAIAYFEEMGMMATIYRHLNTSEYSMNEFFFSTTTRKNLSLVFNFFIPFALSLLAAKPVTTQLNINVELFNKLNQPVRESNNYAYDAREHVNGKFSLVGLVLQLTEKGIRLKANTYGKLKQLVEKFPMTEHGMIKLSVYPPEAIDYAMNSMNNVFAAKDPFLYFMHLCKYYCDQNKVNVDWSEYHTSRKALNIPIDMPYTNEEDIAPLRVSRPLPKQRTWNKKEPQQWERSKPAPHVETPTETTTRVFLDKFDTPFKYAEELERALHAAVVEDPSHKRTLFFPPRWNSLSAEEQRLITSRQHTGDCVCGNTQRRQLFLF